jgi:hypothetical protein
VNWFPASVDIPFNGHLAKHFNLADYTTYMEQFFSESTTFFLKKKVNRIYKKCRGAQPLVHWEYTKGTKGEGRNKRENQKN